MVTQFQENSKPIYRQIADLISNDIIQGLYPPDGRLPSVREYAAAVQVNVNTVMRAYDYLASNEIIFNRRGIGYFVAADAVAGIRRLHEEKFLNDEINYFFQRLSTLGITPDTLAQLYKNYLQQ